MLFVNVNIQITKLRVGLFAAWSGTVERFLFRVNPQMIVKLVQAFKAFVASIKLTNADELRSHSQSGIYETKNHEFFAIGGKSPGHRGIIILNWCLEVVARDNLTVPDVVNF